MKFWVFVIFVSLLLILLQTLNFYLFLMYDYHIYMKNYVLINVIEHSKQFFFI